MLDLLVGVAGLLCALAVMFGWRYYRIPILPAPAVPKRGQTRALGIDIGGVIITHVARSQRESTKEDTSFAESFLKTPPVPGAIQHIQALVKRFGKPNVFIISYAGSSMEQKSKLWLTHHNFYEKTGLLERNVVVCRIPSQKATICDRLGITHFVDDHQRILKPMIPLKEQGKMKRLVLLNTAGESIEDSGMIHEAQDWPEAAKLLCEE